jgi:hypothetical protein
LALGAGDHCGRAEVLRDDVGPQHPTRFLLLGRLATLRLGPPLGLYLPLEGFARGVGPGPAFFGRALMVDQLLGLPLGRAPVMGQL